MITPFKKSSLRPISHKKSVINKQEVKDPDSEIIYVYKMEYEQTYQIGIICLVSLVSNLVTIHPHELTLSEKETYYFNQLNSEGEQLNPVIFIHKQVPGFTELMNKLIERDCSWVIRTDDQITHRLWEISDPGLIGLVTKLYSFVTRLYLADGHHRLAAIKRLNRVKNWVNQISAFLIPEEQIKICSFHRILHFQQGLIRKNFLRAINEYFVVSKVFEPFQPSEQTEFGLYIDCQWYAIRLKETFLNLLKKHNCIGTHILEKYVLNRHGNCSVSYLSSDKGLHMLKEQVDALKQAVGFSVAPIAIENFLQIAKSGLLLPPHTTCFLPKPINNIVTYSMDLHNFSSTLEAI